MKYTEIGKIAGCTEGTVSKHLTQMGIFRKHKELQSKMIKLHEQGLYDREIAEQLGCSRSNVTSFLNKKGYTDRKSKINDMALRNRISNSLIGRYTGKNNPNYKNYNEAKKIARGILKTFSKRIMRNRNYTCEHCGKRGGNLEVHHIKPFNVIFKNFMKTRYSGNIDNIYNELMSYEDFIDEDNLVLLCEDCHYKVHYSDNHELSPYRWESATTIETTN